MSARDFYSASGECSGCSASRMLVLSGTTNVCAIEVKRTLRTEDLNTQFIGDKSKVINISKQ